MANERLGVDLHESEGKVKQLVEKVEESKAANFYREKLVEIQSHLDRARVQGDFFSACGCVFDSWIDISSYTFMELSQNGQKLISPKYPSSKYKEMPSLWLGKVCGDGIEFFAQNLANQVSLDMIGGNLMSLLVRGASELPDKLLFIQLEDEELLSGLKWSELEEALTSLHRYFMLRNEKVSFPQKEALGPWDMLTPFRS